MHSFQALVEVICGLSGFAWIETFKIFDIDSRRPCPAFERVQHSHEIPSSAGDVANHFAAVDKPSAGPVRTRANVRRLVRPLADLQD